MNDSTAPAVRIPRSALAMLSHRCASLGTDGIRALREGGYRAGVVVCGSLDERPGEMPVGAFRAAVSAAFEDAGLGALRFETVSPAIGAVAWRGSAEAFGTRSERPGTRCHFAAGVLGGVLSRAAGKAVDVLEVRCGAGGDEPCWFLFGAVANMRTVQEARRAAAERAATREAVEPSTTP